MGKPEKLYEKWLDNAPPEVRLNDVLTVLERYFPGHWRWEGGSHIVVQHDELRNYIGFHPYGEFTIAVKSGKMVKKHYLKDFVNAIKILVELGIV